MSTLFDWFPDSFGWDPRSEKYGFYNSCDPTVIMKDPFGVKRALKDLPLDLALAALSSMLDNPPTTSLSGESEENAAQSNPQRVGSTAVAPDTEEEEDELEEEEEDFEGQDCEEEEEGEEADDGSLCEEPEAEPIVLAPSFIVQPAPVHRVHVSSFTLEDGSKFSGTLINGLPEGQGRIRYFEGSLYTGELRQGVFSGRGRFRYPDGRCYSGEFSNGLFDGIGVQSAPDGRFWGGVWESGRPRFVYCKTKKHWRLRLYEDGRLRASELAPEMTEQRRVRIHRSPGSVLLFLDQKNRLRWRKCAGLPST